MTAPQRVPSPCPLRGARYLVLGLFFLGLLPADTFAWPAPAYRNMIYDIYRLLPPPLARVLIRNDSELAEGVQRLDAETASRLIRDGRRGGLSQETIEAIEARITRVADMVGEHRPFSEIAFELGTLLRIAADLADPTILGAGDPRVADAAAEYQRFVELHLREFPLVYDHELPSTLEGGSVRATLEALTETGRASVDSIAEAFWRDGSLVPATEFDYRSVPYAVASLAYSRAVTAASYLWLAAWSQANGDFTGYRFFRRQSSSESASKSERDRP